MRYVERGFDDFVEPIPAVGIDEGVARGHFGDVVWGVEVIAFDVGVVGVVRYCTANGRFTTAGGTPDDEERDVLCGRTFVVFVVHCHCCWEQATFCGGKAPRIVGAG